MNRLILTITNRPATRDDIPQMVALNTEAMMAQWGQPFWSIEEIESRFSNPKFDADNHTRLWFDENSAMVALTIVYLNGNPPVRAFFDLSIHPTYPHYQTLGAECIAWVESVVQGCVWHLCPPEMQISMSTRIVADYEPNQQLYVANGFTKIRQLWEMALDLQEDIPDPELEEGFSIRTIRYPDEGRALYRITDDAFADHFGYTHDPEGKNYDNWAYRHFDNSLFDPTMWFVAEYHGDYAGFAWTHLGMPEDPTMGWVNMLGVLPTYRKKGVGLAVLRHAFRVFRERGMDRAGLGVDSESLTGATRLYTRAGMHATSKWDTFIKVLRDGVDLTRS